MAFLIKTRNSDGDRPAALSLVELLVLIAVIGILAALILAGSYARRQGKATLSLWNRYYQPHG
jgi:type II secretory pathway pseudopilin PulG